MDSLFLKTKDIYPELREGYEILVNYYKDKNDLHNQLAYVQRMLVIDSIINKNFHYLDTKLIKEYNRVQLKAERKQINAKIKSIENNYLYKIVTGIIFIIVLIILLILKHLKHKKYKQKFKILMRQLESSDNDSLSQKEKEDLTKKNIGIKPDLITELICKLENFEKEHGFLDPNINRSILTKKMNTNLVYLSKIINYHRGKTFVNYINDLRVDYAIQQLKSSDKIFINWSIEAIAKEVGFKNAEPFSKAFFRKTGIKPSFFIKSLEKDTDFRKTD
jgi:AraC-like DNA-binding protein